MKESEFQSLWTKYIRANWKNGSVAFELKITKTGSLPFTRLEEHQEEALKKAKHKLLAHKISDMSLNAKPFDMFVLQDAAAYVVVLFYEEGKDKVAYLIDIDEFIKEKQISVRKSLTAERARQIAHFAVTI
jgi:penicillin-binding protein-related factor A (putative recombinase)